MRTLLFLLLSLTAVFARNGINIKPLQTIILQRSEISHKARNSVLHNLKLRQTGVSLLETDQDEPLQQQLLKEKHLATYYGNLRIGDSNTQCLFDTGSSEFWTISDECTTSRCNRHQRFPHSRAGRLLKDTTLMIKYLSGRVEGSVVEEDVGIGSIVVRKQPVGIARVVDIKLLDDVKWSCILGLAYPNAALKAKGIYSVFDNIMRQHLLTNHKLLNQFAYYLDESKGALTFGGVNCDLLSSSHRDCSKQFHFVPVIEKGYWTIGISDVKVRYPDGTTRGGVCSGTCKAIVDTGTYLIYAPEVAHSKLFGDINVKNCGDISSMPILEFHLFTGSSSPPLILEIPPEQYVLRFEVNSREDCVDGVSPDKDTLWTLGQVFLRSFYALFDRDKDRIGFAKLSHPPRKDGKTPQLFGVNPRFKQL